ncbi:MAG: 7TM diverse intracellular signaling domain-containing protein [Bacteroidia bacterium]
MLINSTTKNIEVGKNFTFIEDETNKLSINDVIKSQEFKIQENSDIPNFNVSKSSFWVKVVIQNLTNQKDLLLQISQPGLDEVEFYFIDNNGKMTGDTAGEFLPFDKRKFPDANYIFRIQMDSGALAEAFIKVRARDNIQVPMKIGTPDNIAESNRTKAMMAGVYVGIMLVMFVYNAFLFFTVRDKGYFYYVIYLGTVLLTQAGIQGYTFQYLWPGLPALAQLASFIFPPLVGIASFSFLRVFLHTANYFPKLDKGFHFFTAVYLIAIVLALAGYYKASFQLIEVCATIVSLYMLAVAYLILKKGYRPARFFILAWSFFLVGVTIYVMKDFGLLPYNNFTYYTMPAGSAIEVVLLSFALADRINILKKEKEDTQAEVLKALKINEKLITDQNVVLEKSVAERTEELQQTNGELNVTLKNLKEAQSQLVDAAKMASLGQLTAGIAHEINNPINFVSANIKPLQMDIADIMELIAKYETITPGNGIEAKLEDIAKFKKRIDLDYVKTEVNTLLGGIEDGAKRTAEIVKGLKNFSHLDESDVKESDINQGIESTLVLLRSIIPKNIEVVKKLGVIPMIECYPGKLNQVFMNIFSNAVQAMESVPREEKHTLTIESYVDGPHVCVSVQDTGTGMTPEVKEKVFEPFFTTKDVGSGTGLGMSIVFKIIESHHAKIDIDTAPGKGTKMTIILPMKLNVHNN